MTYLNINDTALVDVMANETLPFRDVVTKERSYTKGETQILNLMKHSIEQAQRDLHEAQTGLKACTDEYNLINDAVNTGITDHKKEIDKNSREQEEIQEELNKQAETIEFYNEHRSQPATTTKKTRKAARNANDESWFKRNKGMMIPILMILTIDLVGFICTLSLQREAFSVAVIVARISCVLGICLISGFAHNLFNQIDAEEKLRRAIAGCCLGLILFLGVLTTAHSVVLAITTVDSAETTGFNLDLVETPTEMPTSNSLKDNIYQAVIMNPGVAEVLLACALAVISLLCALPALSKKSTKAENTIPQLQAASGNEMLDFYIQREQLKQQKLAKKLNDKIAAAAALNKSFETTMSGYNDHLPDLSNKAKEWNVKLVEAKARLAYLVDEALQSMVHYRTVFCEIYREKNHAPLVVYEPVTKADLEKYYNI